MVILGSFQKHRGTFLGHSILGILIAVETTYLQKLPYWVPRASILGISKGRQRDTTGSAILAV